MAAPRTIRDDRGAEVRLFALGAAFTVGTDDMPREVVARLRDRLRGRIPGVRAAWLYMGILLVVVAGLIAFSARGGWTIHRVERVLLYSGLFVFMFWTWRWRIERQASRQVREAMLAESRCPSCAYELTGAPIGDDGCCPCPECGAAWRPVAHPPAVGGPSAGRRA